MDKMREEFEAWVGEYFNGTSIERRGHGYNDLLSDALWISWQASRAALCVELPDGSYCGFEGDSFHACMCGVESCKDILDEAGVNHK